MSPVALAGATIVLTDRLLSPGTLVIDEGRIVDLRPGTARGGGPASLPLHGHYIVPGFVDVHIHGVSGLDTLGGPGSIRQMAAYLPRHGVTAFCPTSVACSPSALRLLLEEVREVRERPDAGSARVLPAHLESNFINADYAGAQPGRCLRDARQAIDHWSHPLRPLDPQAFDGDDVLREITRATPDVGTVTLAPEIDGGLDLIRWLVERGVRVSLGHSGATFDEAMAAVAAGARQATHLFNRMAQMNHRAPGLAGATLQTEELAAEIICDGVHVHPGMVRAAVAAKHPSRVLAITDATAAAGLPAGTRAHLGEQSITAGPSAAYLDDGTLAGGTATMDGVFRMLVDRMGLSLSDAATLCATTPARELGLVGHGVLAVDAVADLVVLDRELSVVQTYVGGRLVA
jgi:N-acetylglucosamine-6-phosphate deacetylase